MITHPRLAHALLALGYAKTDFIVQDDGDGPYLVSLDNPPTQEQVDAVTVEQLDAAQARKALGPNPVISDRQFAQALKMAGVITFQEAMAFVQVGAIPALLQAAVDAIQDQDTREAAALLIAGATQFYRLHPMTIALGTALGWTSEQMDALWASAAAL
jgi:hypothetical protein